MTVRLRHYPVDQLKQEIREAVGKHLDLSRYRLFFFGSRVSGKGSENSDIDVGIEGPRTIATQTMSRIREEIEQIHTLYSIDIVDLKATSEKFRAVAKQHLEPIEPL